MGVCCRIGECCPPDVQARELAAWLAENEPKNGGRGPAPVEPGSYEEIARRLLAEYRIVPLRLEAGPDADGPGANVDAANRVLESLHKLLDHQMKTVLQLAGHPTEE